MQHQQRCLRNFAGEAFIMLHKPFFLYIFFSYTPSILLSIKQENPLTKLFYYKKILFHFVAYEPIVPYTDTHTSFVSR